MRGKPLVLAKRWEFREISKEIGIRRLKDPTTSPHGVSVYDPRAASRLKVKAWSQFLGLAQKHAASHIKDHQFSSPSRDFTKLCCDGDGHTINSPRLHVVNQVASSRS